MEFIWRYMYSEYVQKQGSVLCLRYKQNMLVNITKSIAKRWNKRLLFTKTPKPDERKEIRVIERSYDSLVLRAAITKKWLSGTRNINYKLAEKE